MDNIIGGELIEMADLKFDHLKAQKIMEELRKKAAKDFGVTVQGPYVTLRFDNKQVTMIVISMTCDSERTPIETPQ